jgi:hypothetical protein
MKTFILKSSFILLIISAFFACSEDDSAPILSPEAAATKAATITSGSVQSIDKDTLSTGEFTLEVKMITTSGSVVELEFYEASGALREITGEEAPFDYDVNPGMGLLTFADARAIALTELPGEIIKWQLEQNSLGVWIYEIEIMINGNADKVKINASTGEIIV